MAEGTVPQHDSPKKDWVVTITGHFQDVEKFCEEVEEDLASHHPEVSYTCDFGDGGEVQAVIKMVWNSPAMEQFLTRMVSGNIQLHQHREGQSCQDIT